MNQMIIRKTVFQTEYERDGLGGSELGVNQVLKHFLKRKGSTHNLREDTMSGVVKQLQYVAGAVGLWGGGVSTNNSGKNIKRKST